MQLCIHHLSQFARKVGVSVKTIQKWDSIGVLPAKRTINNRRYYADEDLAAALRLPHARKDRSTVAYCRVSSQARIPDLLNQQAVLHPYLSSTGLSLMTGSRR